MNLRYFLSIGMILSGVLTFLFGFAKVMDIHSIYYFVTIQVSNSYSLGPLCFWRYGFFRFLLVPFSHQVGLVLSLRWLIGSARAKRGSFLASGTRTRRWEIFWAQSSLVIKSIDLLGINHFQDHLIFRSFCGRWLGPFIHGTRNDNRCRGFPNLVFYGTQALLGWPWGRIFSK